ncbi:unnamed protein product [Lasius platythorax]|uniref:Uncharacterized protein n=1 Tax=Lasius platythorax TaxID=488582 RepID=A0AAV2N5T5_9HYME
MHFHPGSNGLENVTKQSRKRNKEKIDAKTMADGEKRRPRRRCLPLLLLTSSPSTISSARSSCPAGRALRPL